MLLVALSLRAAPPLGACPGGTALKSFELAVSPLASAERQPLFSLTRLPGGSRLVYTPKENFDASATEDAEVSLISIPTTPTGVLGVMEAQKASSPAEWLIPSQAAAVALVYAPQGLKLSKISDLVRRDPQLIPQLAFYAEKSAQTELLMDTVAQWERSGSSQSLEAALAGFSSRSGVALPTLTRGATTDQQALTLMRALHPTLATFDPLAPTPQARLAQSGSLAASVAGLFFGNPVGLATAGGAMFLNLRSMMFPGSEFRTALTQQAGDVSVLCAKREPAKSRTKLVYLWAWKLPGLPAPRLEGLPYRVNLGVSEFTLPLKGVNLENIVNVHASSPAVAAVEFVRETKTLTVRPAATAKKGDRLDLRIDVEDSPAPLVLPGAVELLNPRPVLAGARTLLPADLPLQLRAGELPANAFTNVSLSTKGASGGFALHLECADPALTLKKLSLRPGEQAGSARLRPVRAGEFFLSLEPGTVGQADCEVDARLESADGVSDPVRLGRLVRMPRIEKFALTKDRASAASYAGWLEGEELEAIEKTGWQADQGEPVAGAPLPVSNNGHRQRLKIAMPWPPPAPQAPLYVWLRGETEGRRTAVTY